MEEHLAREVPRVRCQRRLHRHTWRKLQASDLPDRTGTLPQVNEDIASTTPTLHFVDPTAQQ